MSAGLGSLYKRGNVWWISYYWRGERKRESSKSTLKKDAEQLLKTRLGETSKGIPVVPNPANVYFEDLAELIRTDYAKKKRKATRRLESALKHLERHLGRLRALDITSDRIDRYHLDREAEGAAPATIQKELAALKRAFRLAKKHRKIAEVPWIEIPEVNNTRTNFLTLDEVNAIAGYIGPDLAPVVRFAALTGWRKEEVLSLQWSQVDLEAGVVRLLPGTTKNNEGRSFPYRVLPDLDALIDNQLERTRDLERETETIIPWVFHRDGQRIRDFRWAWNNACTLAGCKGAWFHDLRRTAVKALERAGVPRSVAMKLTGHKTEAIYRRYAIVATKDLEEGVEKLARMHGERTTKKTRKVVPMERKQA